MKGVNKENVKKHALNEFLSEYKELNADNKYRPVAVGRYGIRKRESIYSKELAKDYSKNKLIHKDTLTVGMGSKQIDIGILIEDETFAVSPAYHTYEIQGIRCKYLEYCLQSKNIEMFSLYAKRGSRQGKSIDLKRWLTYKIPVYSEEDQIVIEENLNKINVVIELRRKQLELLDELVRARFVEMFGDPVHSEKYGTRKLSSCVAEKSDMVDGPFGSQVNTKVDYIENGEIPVIRTVNVKMMSFSPTDLKYMTREKYETVIRSQVLPGDVILTKVGTIGNVCIFPNTFDEAVLSTTGSCRIRVDNSVVNTQFFAYNLMYLKGKLLEIASAGVQPFLNMNHVKNIDILDVSLEKQKEFADFVKEVDKSRLHEQLAVEYVKLLAKDL